MNVQLGLNKNRAKDLKSEREEGEMISHTISSIDMRRLFASRMYYL